MDPTFPVLPFRSTLYTPDELFDGFDPGRPGSYADTPDFLAYRSTRLGPNREVGMLRALHDQCITEARDVAIDGTRVVAIMGGHELGRDDPAYADVVELAAAITSHGILVATGGGPGAMEAAHLGAMLAADPTARSRAVATLASSPSFPSVAGSLLDQAASPDPAVLRALHDWQRPAFEIWAATDPASRCRSLAVPTWFYGHEPPTPFATHIAKYFSNSLREDGLLAIAVDGIVFGPGSAGTLQEVFQDACQNHYRVFHDRFSPMAFLDRGGCWTGRFPVGPLLETLFGPEDFARHVCIDADLDVIRTFLVDHPDALTG
ncbi:MAG: hypothetical protein KDB02_03110 [Acidimicrobiales bacterium]|nr:hypothetical protein [Acidimicrobiales bacterium]